MGDVGPESLVSVHELECWAKAFALHRHPEGVDGIGGQFAFGTGGVQFAFEIVERDLADDCVDHILDLAGQHDLAFGGVLAPSSIFRNVSISPNTLAVSARVSGVEDSISP